MSYGRFGLMILTSTVVMFVLMYLNTYAWEHVFFSETRAYMAALMGAAMAFVMMALMLAMYPSWVANAAILAGALVAFAAALWLVRSQATVSGVSYMRAMIPHHSIAVMTSERAAIRDARVRKLADEIVAAQRREIAEMRYLIAEVPGGGVAGEVYEDPPARRGTVEEALANTLRAQLDPAPVPAAEARQVVSGGATCRFAYTREADPVLWTTADQKTGVIKLNGVIVPLGGGEAEGGFVAPGATVTVRPLGTAGGLRGNADLLLALRDGPTVGYRGFYACGG